ncbi:hypothetical protein [Peribacillus sp. V2I11]|nr:hypothetical protein [Peribacillus sp. V2I11]
MRNEKFTKDGHPVVSISKEKTMVHTIVAQKRFAAEGQLLF